MNVIWHKVWHDLWQHKGRTLLTIISIAAGVFAIGAIFGMVDQLLSGMDSAHQAVSPSHVNIILRDFVDEETAATLKDIDGVVDVDPVNQLSVRYKATPDAEWELGTVVMRADYDEQIYDEVVLNEGAWPAGNEIGIERLSSQFYGIEIGEEVIFEIGGEPQSFPVNGKIRHPFVQPPPFGGQAHFFTDAEGLGEFGIPAGFYGQLLVRVEPYSLEQAQDIAGDIRAALGDQGVSVVVTLYQDPEAHWGRMFVEGINLVLQVMAVVTLMMSVILVFNAMTALITQQTDQIGVIKATGGGRGTIVKTYLAGVLIYGLLALLIALPLSALFAFLMSRWFLNLFNIEIITFQWSNTAIILQIVAALLVPIIAALLPVLKGSAITVREAMGSYGVGADFGASRFDQVVERLGALFLPVSYAAALGNVFRRKGRLVLTLLVLVVAGTMFLVVMSLISSTTRTLDNEMARQRYDLQIGFTQDYEVDPVLTLLKDDDEVVEAELWFSRNATILREGERMQDSAGLGAQLLGIPIGSDMIRPLMASGRWLEPADANVVVMNAETASANNIALGDMISLDLGMAGALEWELVGTYREVYGVGFYTEPIYAPQEAAWEAVGQRDVGSRVVVRTEADTLTENSRIADTLQDRFKEDGREIDFYTTSIKLEERAYADEQFGTVTSMLVGLAMLVATVGGIGLAGALGISVMERRREIGVMRAVGAGSRIIMSLFVMEGVIQGLISWIIAVPLAILLAPPLARQLGQIMIEVELDFAFNWPAVWAWLVLVLMIALFASILPARRAAGFSVRESLAYA